VPESQQEYAPERHFVSNQKYEYTPTIFTGAFRLTSMTIRSKRHRLIEIDWPDFGHGSYPAKPPAIEFQRRIECVRSVMDNRGFTHFVVYGDREHFANLAYLTGFDPRFEEAFLVVARDGKPLLIVGNECDGYVSISPLFRGGQLRSERFQSFSLLNQPREQSRLLREILAGEGICATSSVGCAGWKYFSEPEHPDPLHSLDIPAYIADTLRDLAGRERVVNATDALMHPGYGLRSFCTPYDIAYFECTNVQASESLKRMLFGMCEGMTDHAVIELARLNGEPLGCHVTFATGDNAMRGLSSPSGELIRRGEPLSTNISYFGSNICRAGWIAHSERDLPENARDYVRSFAGPYFEAMNEWFGLLKPGVAGGRIWQLIQDRLPFGRFSVFLNPGHLIHLDEWLSSPIYLDSDVPLHAGMAIQVDVIPSSPIYFSTRMEDGVVLADENLRAQLRATFPDCYQRCQARRKFMTEVLGFELPDEVLPLSNTAGIVPPFFLTPNSMFALET
jgi:hypothetical protein